MYISIYKIESITLSNNNLVCKKKTLMCHGSFKDIFHKIDF